MTKPGYRDGPHPTCPPFISPNVNVRSWVKRLKRGHQLWDLHTNGIQSPLHKNPSPWIGADLYDPSLGWQSSRWRIQWAADPYIYISARHLHFPQFTCPKQTVHVTTTDCPGPFLNSSFQRRVPPPQIFLFSFLPTSNPSVSPICSLVMQNWNSPIFLHLAPTTSCLHYCNSLPAWFFVTAILP